MTKLMSAMYVHAALSYQRRGSRWRAACCFAAAEARGIVLQ